MFITNKCKSFFLMPFPMQIIFLAGLFSPVIAAFSILSGTVVPSDLYIAHIKYGAAMSLLELLLAVAITIPASIICFFMLMKRKASLFFFPIGYIAVCISPIFLSVFRDNIDYMMPSIYSNLFIGFLASLYLIFSKGVRQYFVESLGPGKTGATR